MDMFRDTTGPLCIADSTSSDIVAVHRLIPCCRSGMPHVHHSLWLYAAILGCVECDTRSMSELRCCDAG